MKNDRKKLSQIVIRWLKTTRPDNSDAPSDLIDSIIDWANFHFKSESCPCIHTTPCHIDCTCINKYSSRGCLRCCTYGSKEQQKQTAEILAKFIDYPKQDMSEEAIFKVVDQACKSEVAMSKVDRPRKIERGYCQCGCGEKTNRAKITDSSKGWIKGEPVRFIQRHGNNLANKNGTKHYKWKGNKAGYFAIHEWIRYHYGNPKKCENCKITNAKKFHWANISGKYKRDIKDFKRLCAKCHKLFDKKAREE